MKQTNSTKSPVCPCPGRTEINKTDTQRRTYKRNKQTAPSHLSVRVLGGWSGAGGLQQGGIESQYCCVVAVQLSLRVLQVAQQAAQQLLRIVLHVALKHGVELPGGTHSVVT